MKKTALIVLSLLVTPLAFAEKVVSDSLVKNLPCSQVSAKEIYRRIDNSQFSSFYHQAVVNWPFNVGVYDIAACWSLSRSQRLFFYLARWNTPMPSQPGLTQELLNMIRGSIPFSSPGSSRVSEMPLKPLKVFNNEDDHLESHHGLMSTLMDGIDQYLPANHLVNRNFRSEIEFYQTQRFHKFSKNLKYVIGTGARSDRRNRQTKDTLVKNLRQNLLTMIILRPTRIAQHVVLVKRFEQLSNGDIDFWVYDSNQPTRDQRLTYRANADDFFAPEIIWGFVSPKKVNEAVGIYIVDEEDRAPIEQALLTHYRNLCAHP
ncbi:MAG: hypothetical protein J7501_08820 [Bdellovibrio sp.]|nr:hypothetical protein [Bdellovibrio sp.]